MLLPLGMLSRAPPLPHPGNLSYKVVSSLYQRACCVNSTRLSNRKRPQKSSPVVATVAVTVSVCECTRVRMRVSECVRVSVIIVVIVTAALMGSHVD